MRSRPSARSSAALAVLLAGLAACVPLSEQPAGDPQSAVFDTRLQGAWRAVGREPFLAFVGPADETGRGLHVVTVEETREGQWQVDEYDGMTTRRGTHGFLSVRYETAGGERRGWVIARYALAGRSRLELSTLDRDRLAALVRAGKLAGRVSGDGPFADIDLSAGSVDLLAVLESAEGRRLFGAPHTLMRIDATGASHGGERKRPAPCPPA